LTARPIEDRKQAVRLAHAILGDVRLYHVAGTLAEELEEGRCLFEARVVEDLRPVWAEAVEEARRAGHLPADDVDGGPRSPAPTTAAGPVLPPALAKAHADRAAALVEQLKRDAKGAFNEWLAKHREDYPGEASIGVGEIMVGQLVAGDRRSWAAYVGRPALEDLGPGLPAASGLEAILLFLAWLDVEIEGGAS